MRVSGATVQKFLLGMALLSALVWNLAHASEINGLQLSNGATGTRAEIALDQPVEFKLIRLSAPERLVVDLPATKVHRGLVLPAGAGLVKVTATAKGAVKRLAIDPSLFVPEEREVVEDLIVAAVQDAQARAMVAAQEEMGKITEGLELPPGMKLPF